MVEKLLIKAIDNIVTGGLQEAIRVHGPITRNLISSASKRIAGGIKGHLMQNSASLQDAAIKKLIEDKDKEIARLRQKVITQGKSITNLVNRISTPKEQESSS